MDLSYKTIWVAFLDENGSKVEGFFELVKETETYLKIKSKNNLLTIPYSRVLKTKENNNSKGGN